MNRHDFNSNSQNSQQNRPQVRQQHVLRGVDLTLAQLASLQQQRGEASNSEIASQQQCNISGSSCQQLLCEAQQPLLPPRMPASAEAAVAAVAAAASGRHRQPMGGGGGGGHHSVTGRRRIMREARKHPTVDRIITLLQDKRIDDDQLEQIQDLQLPLLRKILNVIFISLGVIFLLGVIIVIVYTNIGKDDHSKKT